MKTTEPGEPTEFDKEQDRQKLKEWAYTLAEHRKFCHEFFGGRADKIIEISKSMAEDKVAGPTQALDICMQIEAEFPRRLEEITSEAKTHPSGILIGLTQYIQHLRTTSG